MVSEKYPLSVQEWNYRITQAWALWLMTSKVYSWIVSIIYSDSVHYFSSLLWAQFFVAKKQINKQKNQKQKKDTTA